jgi:hypothetical protein
LAKNCTFALFLSGNVSSGMSEYVTQPSVAVSLSSPPSVKRGVERMNTTAFRT